ncbi:MAG: hypothetical protein JSV62_16185 [Promethearchaeota archaeon]|nr:MAG: hypothetical protein JSV62_16185 [Candidatus Lokiarchaeota archaeon]
MNDTKLKFYMISKLINKEILIEELLRVRGISKDPFLSRYNKKKKRIKLKIIFTKIFYSIIFGILPIFPLIAYYDVRAQIFTADYLVSIIIFGESLVFVFFFLLQFLNIFFMGMIEVSLIISGSIFGWLETLPIPTERIAKLKYLTIFRSFDIPILVIMFSFPIGMFVVSSNFIIFIVCLAVSILNILFTFNILILFGAKISKILDINQLSARRTLGIRLFNTFGYVLVMFGSVFLIQWAINSIEIFFTMFAAQPNPALTNLILSNIPYPFTSTYLLSFLLVGTYFHPHYLVSLISGMGLFIIFIYWVSKKAFNALKRLNYPEFEGFRKYKEFNIAKKEIKVRIKIRKPKNAHLIKDLLVASRNLKVFLSIITPIIISVVGIYTLNLTLLGPYTPLDVNFFYNFGVILPFQIIISGILIYSLLNLEGSKESLLFALPINPKDQANAKLFLLFITQTLSTIAPYLLYIFDHRFLNLFTHIILSLPYVWIFLLIMFELYIYLFGRTKYKYVIEEIRPENKIIKWIGIYFIVFILCIWLITAILSLYLVLDYIFFIYNYFQILLVSYAFLYLGYHTLFSPKTPKTPKSRKDKKVGIKLNSTRIWYYCKICRTSFFSNNKICQKCGTKGKIRMFEQKELKYPDYYLK